jgi:20S proteasome alpha/beta subunit
VACICDGEKSVVAAMDRMVTSEMLSIEFEQQQTKIHQLSSHCVVMSAGDALAPADILRDAASEVRRLTNPSIRQIARVINERFIEHRKQAVEETVLKPRGFRDLDDFYEKMRQLPPDIYTIIDDNINRFHVISETSCIMSVAGIDDTGAHIYQVCDPGTTDCFDSLGFHATGSGEPHAVSLITSYDYTGRFPLNHAIWIAYESKRRAEKAPGVGRGTDMCIIQKETGVEFLSSDVISRLEAAFNKKQSQDASWLSQVPNFVK